MVLVLGMENNHKEEEEEGEVNEKDEVVGPMGGDGEEEVDQQGDVGSSLTMERVAAAKKFIENHYRAQMKHIRERKERY